MTSLMSGLLRQYKVLGVVFLALVVLAVWFTSATFTKKFSEYDEVKVETSKIGLQLPMRADVKIRGVLVGEVLDMSSTADGAELTLGLYPSQVHTIPSNVTASIVPKTLFGEKYVDLVIPPRPSTRRLGEGDVITQDRSRTAIELETVLDDVLPLLRAVRPAQLNATLSALASALEGRGNQLGENLELVNRYFTRLNPELPTINRDIRGIADVSRIYADAAPDLVRTLRNLTVTSRTIAAKQQVYAGFLAGTAGFATTTRGILQEDGDRLIRVGQVSRPTLGLLARYAPEYPCLLQGLAESNQTLGQAFSHGELHITLEVVLAQDKYRPGDEPVFGEQSGPNCRGLPRPPVPEPGSHLADGTGGGPAGDRVPTLVDPDSGPAGTAAEQGVVDPLVAPAMGTPASDVPDVATLLFGPLARGTAVGQQ